MFCCRLPELLGGLIQIILLRGKAAWTLLPAGLAICRWSILRWGSIPCSLKIRSPSWGRNIETLNDFEEPNWGGGSENWMVPLAQRRATQILESDRAKSNSTQKIATCQCSSQVALDPKGNWDCAGLLWNTPQQAAGPSRLGCVQFHYGTLNNYFLKWLLCRFKLF